jgi:hypothetical protein
MSTEKEKIIRSNAIFASLCNTKIYETPLVTSGISRSAVAQCFGGAHRGRVCVRVFIGVSVRAYCERLCCNV